MTTSLICFNGNHISAAQAVIADDCVLEAFIHNLAKPSITEIHGYLQEAGFLHTSHMLGDCKLDPRLISALVERWRPETHTFHLPRDVCTITLEDVVLQLGLLVDGSVVTVATTVSGKEDLCVRLLGKVPKKFDGWISMNWLAKIFDKLPRDATEELCRAIELNKMSIGGCLLLLYSWVWWQLPFLRP
ncbi:hypothetical protein Gotur_028246 [Gossypium turneri]